jgi:hypothetical protein
MAEEQPTIRVTDNGARHRYEAFVGDALAGFVTYERTPTGITFIHTKTEPAYEGHGVGGRLAAVALDEARAANLRVTAVCPFIASYIDRHPAYADLLAPHP